MIPPMNLLNQYQNAKHYCRHKHLGFGEVGAGLKIKREVTFAKIMLDIRSVISIFAENMLDCTY